MWQIWEQFLNWLTSYNLVLWIYCPDAIKPGPCGISVPKYVFFSPLQYCCKQGYLCSICLTFFFNVSYTNYHNYMCFLIVNKLVFLSRFFVCMFSSVAQLCPTLHNPMNRSTPGLPVHHQLPEFTQTHIHWVSDAIQPFHPLSFPSPPALNLSQHQGVFQWVSSLHQVAKVLDFSFSISPSNEYSIHPLGWTGWISLQSKGLSRVFSNTTVQKHQFFGTQLSL